MFPFFVTANCMNTNKKKIKKGMGKNNGKNNNKEMKKTKEKKLVIAVIMAI